MASACCRIRKWIKPNRSWHDGIAGSDSVLVSDDLFTLAALLAGGDVGDCIGVYLCHQTAKDMGVHDHGSIVWDEFIGMWITLMALPTNDWQWVAAGFVIFRILDMWKPWPIRWFDCNVHGGMGIMIRRYCRRGDFRRHPVLYRSSLAAGYSVVVVHRCLM